MKNELEHLLEQLRAAQAERRLDQFEPAVWARIAGQRSLAVGWSLRAAMAALVLSVGIVSALKAAPEKPEASAFAINSNYAPSTLLAGRL